ncbi:MAG: response regulator transcription factor [Candidatus Omnitrophica bacterium]|nr:response regulator transcription factor [Candidatus Omnitrophota bacterium]
MSKILIIEDDYDLAFILRKGFQSEGFEAITAYDGVQGTQMAHAQKPDLIMLDLGLPAGGGINTLKNLKLSTNTNFIPVIVLSGTDNQALIQEARDNGIKDFVQKPYEPKDLVELVKKVLKSE